VFDEYASNIKLTQNLKLIRNSQPFPFEKKESRTNSIGYIGRFTKEKGFPFAIDISKKSNEIKPDLKFIFMGEEAKTISDSYRQELTNSDFIIQSFEVQKFYKSIDLALFLSTAPESLPLVVMESISFDTGVIAFPITGVIEILGNDYPLYVKSSEEVMEKLKLYYSDKINLDELRQIHERISKENDYNKMLTAIDKLYSECLSN
jgi:glycosyltransferase involved in cell wall biosynthesis